MKKKENRRIMWAALLILASSGALFGIARASDAGEDPRVYLPVIMYHEVKPLHSGKDAILPGEFEQDLIWLEENGYETVTMAQVEAFCDEGTPLPEKPIVLSFDDGYLNNYLYVLPLLQKYDASIVLSVIGCNADDFTEYPSESEDYAHMTWQQMEEMLRSGCVEMQNHTYDLHGTKKRIGCGRLKGESDGQYEQILSEDVMHLQREMWEHLGVVPTTLAYPYGVYDDLSEAVLRELGFKATLTCVYGVNVLTGDPEELFLMKRICREHGTSMEKLMERAMKTVGGGVPDSPCASHEQSLSQLC